MKVITPSQQTFSKEKTTAAILYGLTTLVLTYPLVFKITDHLIGFGDDNWGNAWNLWWMKYCILNVHHPYHCHLLFHPLDVKLLFHTLNPFHGILSYPVMLFANPSTSLNIITLFNYWLAGFGTFLLARHLHISFFSSWIAGFIFSFSPYLTMHAMLHLSLTGIGWIPIFIVVLSTCFKQPNVKKTCLLVGIACALFYSSPTYFLITCLFIVLWFIVEIFSWNQHSGITAILKRWISLYTISALAGFLIISSPYWIESIREISDEGNYFRSPLRASKAWSADLYSFITPSNLHWLTRANGIGSDVGFEEFNTTLRGLGNLRFHSGRGTESVLYLGVTVCILLIIGISSRNTHIKKRIWLTSLILFTLLTLGPVIHVNGVGLGYHDIDLCHYLTPFTIISKIPGIGGIRMPSRYFIIGILSASIIAASGLDRIKKWKRVRSHKPYLMVTIFACLVFEYASIPLPLTPVPALDVFNQVSSRSDHMGCFLDLPPGWRTGTHVDPTERTVLQYYQTHHHCPIINGQISRTPRWKINYFRRNKIFRWMQDVALSGFEMPNPPMDYDAWIQAINNVFSPQYIVIHRKAMIHNRLEPLLNPNTEKWLNDWVNIFWDIKPLSENEMVSIYTVDPEKPNELTIDFSKPWSNVYLLNGIPVHYENDGWIQGTNAQIQIPGFRNAVETIVFELKAFEGLPDDPEQTAQIDIDGHPLAKITISSTEWNRFTFQIPWEYTYHSRHILGISTTYARSPWEVFHDPDTRHLSVRLKTLRIY